MIESGTLLRLLELLKLPANWDNEGALPIRLENVLAAIDISRDVMQSTTPAPSVVPTNRGGVQLEWHTGGLDLEVEIVSPTRVVVLIGSWEYEVSRA